MTMVTNGANVVVVTHNGKIVVVRHNYRDKKLALPGGRIEAGETARCAARRETEEETGVLISEKNLRLVAKFRQRPSGRVFLYEALSFHGKVTDISNDEIAEVRLMSFSEIAEQEDQFGLGYLRMIQQYLRCVRNLDKLPHHGRLSNPVFWPNDVPSLKGSV